MKRCLTIFLTLSLLLAALFAPARAEGAYVAASTPLGDSAVRISNIRLAAEAINGVFVPYGGSFSFNDTVGARTAERGYQSALNGRGARVRGAGSSVIAVEGGIPLHAAEHRVIADRICAATYLSAAALAGGEVTVEGVPRAQLAPVTDLFTAAGCRLREEPHRVTLTSDGRLRRVPPVRTAPYPGFPTDAQPPVMAALTRAAGSSVFVETIFENRYRHTQELARMGADIRVEGRVAVVTGVLALHGAGLEAADLRGGAALVVAALGAEGESEITGIHHIRRGYDGLPRNLAALGANIAEV